MTPDLERDYRPNIGITLFNRQGQVWLGHRMPSKESSGDWNWQMPQGGIDKGELPVAAALRELNEETGVASAQLLTITPGWLTYDYPADLLDGPLPGRVRKWKGQRQKWAAVLFTGEDQEINIQHHDHQEFSEWRWGELESVPELIIPFKRGVYEEVVDAFKPLRDFIAAQLR